MLHFVFIAIILLLVAIVRNSQSVNISFKGLVRGLLACGVAILFGCLLFYSSQYLPEPKDDDVGWVFVGYLFQAPLGVLLIYLFYFFALPTPTKKWILISLYIVLVCGWWIIIVFIEPLFALSILTIVTVLLVAGIFLLKWVYKVLKIA